jgi:hypothetical protein
MKLSVAITLLTSSHAFHLPHSMSTSWSKVHATTLDPSSMMNTGVGGAVAPSGWECDEEANCVEVPACDDKVCRTSLDVRIHGKWYDLSGKSPLALHH